MENHNELMETPSEFPRETGLKWLRTLFYLHLASLAVGGGAALPMDDQWLTWGSRLITVGAILCLFRLACANGRYRKAAIFRAVYLGGALASSLLFSSTILMLAASVCSMISDYQEYHAHAEMTAADPKLSEQWRGLFTWAVITGIIVGFGSFLTAVVVSLADVGTAATAAIVVAILSVPSLIFNVVYLVYLHRTIRIFQAE